MEMKDDINENTQNKNIDVDIDMNEISKNNEKELFFKSPEIFIEKNFEDFAKDKNVN